jgi:4-phytase/acid phosphatase
VRLTKTFRRAALCTVAILATASGARSAAITLPGFVLERVVMVERHGVRSPTKSPEALAPYAADPWPAWPVAPGMLTPHGKEGMRLMGAYLRNHYAKAGLWTAVGCPKVPAAYVWADGQDERTRDSGQALLDGAFPGCGLQAKHGPDGEADPLFDATSAGVCPIDPEMAKKAILARTPNGDLDAPGPGYAASIVALSKVLSPRGLPPGPNRLKEKDEDLKIEGPLGVGATMAENILLEYAQGFPANAVGWGRASSESDVAALMPVHNLDSDLTRGAPAVGAARGALIARDIMDAIDGDVAIHFKDEHPAPSSARLVVIAGHDSNIANLGGLLGLDWTLPQQPDNTPPGGALVFEVWRNAKGERFVRTLFFYQTLNQLRTLTPATDDLAASSPQLLSTKCSAGPLKLCYLQIFENQMESALLKTCRGKHFSP